MVNSFNTLSDLVLVSLIDTGDEFAFRELYNRHWGKLYSEAYRRLGDVEKCKDIIQDVFLQFWQKSSRAHVLDVSAYLRQAVRYQVIHSYNQNKNLVNFELPLELLTDPSAQIEDVFFAKELQAYINVWLTLLPEKRRNIFHMRFVEGLSTREISISVGISQKTVQKTLHKAVTDLREALGKFAVLLPLLIIVK